MFSIGCLRLSEASLVGTRPCKALYEALKRGVGRSCAGWDNKGELFEKVWFSMQLFSINSWLPLFSKVTGIFVLFCSIGCLVEVFFFLYPSSTLTLSSNLLSGLASVGLRVFLFPVDLVIADSLCLIDCFLVEASLLLVVLPSRTITLMISFSSSWIASLKTWDTWIINYIIIVLFINYYCGEEEDRHSERLKRKAK